MIRKQGFHSKGRNLLRKCHGKYMIPSRHEYGEYLLAQGQVRFNFRLVGDELSFCCELNWFCNFTYPADKNRVEAILCYY